MAKEKYDKSCRIYRSLFKTKKKILNPISAPLLAEKKKNTIDSQVTIDNSLDKINEEEYYDVVLKQKRKIRCTPAHLIKDFQEKHNPNDNLPIKKLEIEYNKNKNIPKRFMREEISLKAFIKEILRDKSKDSQDIVPKGEGEINSKRYTFDADGKIIIKKKLYKNLKRDFPKPNTYNKHIKNIVNKIFKIKDEKKKKKDKLEKMFLRGKLEVEVKEVKVVENITKESIPIQELKNRFSRMSKYDSDYKRFKNMLKEMQSEINSKDYFNLRKELNDEKNFYYQFAYLDIKPEIGVQVKDGMYIMDGGRDYYKKYNKLSKDNYYSFLSECNSVGLQTSIDSKPTEINEGNISSIFGHPSSDRNLSRNYSSISHLFDSKKQSLLNSRLMSSRNPLLPATPEVPYKPCTPIVLNTPQKKGDSIIINKSYMNNDNYFSLVDVFESKENIKGDKKNIMQINKSFCYGLAPRDSKRYDYKIRSMLNQQINLNKSSDLGEMNKFNSDIYYNKIKEDVAHDFLFKKKNNRVLTRDKVLPKIVNRCNSNKYMRQITPLRVKHNRVIDIHKRYI